MTALRRSLPIAGVLLAAVALRAPTLAFQGYASDTLLFRAWGLSLARGGFEDLLAFPDAPATYFPNYALPFFLLKGLGAGFLAFVSPSGQVWMPAYVAGVKALAVAGDVLIGALLFLWARRLLPARRALLAPALYLFAPGVLYDGAFWGQLDSLHTALALAAFFAWTRNARSLAGVLIVAAIMTKLQAVVFLPLFLLLALRADRVAGFLRERFPVMAATAGFIALPYALALGPQEFARGSLGSVTKYAVLSMNAMNVWWPAQRVAGRLLSDQVGSVPAIFVGFAFFAAAAIAILDGLRRSPADARILEALSLLSLAFFLFPTEMHERYLFPFFAFAAIPAAADRGWLIAYLLIGLGFFVNLLAAVPLVPLGGLSWNVLGVAPFLDAWPFVFLAVFGWLLVRYLKTPSPAAA